MRPIVLKVLTQETVTQAEWQDLFYGVHLVCLWDEKGAIKIYDCLEKDIVAFINVSERCDECDVFFTNKIINFVIVVGSSMSRASPARRTGSAQGLHRRMAQIFYAK